MGAPAARKISLGATDAAHDRTTSIVRVAARGGNDDRRNETHRTAAGADLCGTAPRNVQSAFHHADETRWLVFVEKQGKNSYRWWLWVFAGEDSVVYVLDPTRSHDVPEGHFPADAEGVLIVDRYSVYKAMKQVQEGKLILVFCWAHVRRDFVRSRKRLSRIKGVGADVAASDTRIVSAPPPAKTT